MYDGNIYGECLKHDKRAITEYNVAVDELKKQLAKGQNIEHKLVKKLH